MGEEDGQPAAREPAGDGRLPAQRQAAGGPARAGIVVEAGVEVEAGVLQGEQRKPAGTGEPGDRAGQGEAKTEHHDQPADTVLKMAGGPQRDGGPG